MLHWVSGYLQETSLKLPYLMSSAVKYCVSSIHITRDQEQFHSCRSQFIPLQMIRCSRVWIPEKRKCQHLNIKQHHSGSASTINPLYLSNSRSASFCSFTPPFFPAEIRDKGIMGPVPPFHSKNTPFLQQVIFPPRDLGGHSTMLEAASWKTRSWSQMRSDHLSNRWTDMKISSHSYHNQWNLLALWYLFFFFFFACSVVKTWNAVTDHYCILKQFPIFFLFIVSFLFP